MFNTKTIITVVVVIVLAFAGYWFLISGQKQGSSSGVTKQAVTTTSTTQTGSALDGPGKEFVTQLLAIQNIKFNLQLFADPVFQGLQDWSREILPQETGRPNPFAPLESDTGTQTVNSLSFSGDIGSASASEINISSSTDTKTPVKVNPTIKTNSTKR
ncbi:MAG: hypothetical protein K9M11_02730 [Candidatus Pacebacteria bacterium]|nr:hypothetical protein [Candidatus Paceibacterota bacterium]